MTLLQMSLSGAVMILAVAVLRGLTLHRLPKNAFLVMWSVAVARLLVPYSLRSDLSVYSLLGRLLPAAEAQRDIPTGALLSFVQTDAMLSAPGEPVAAYQPGISIDWWTVLWLVGAVACAVFFGTAYLKCRREFQASLPVESDYAKRWLSGHALFRAVELRQSGRISAPLTYGVFRPVILMPKTTDWNDRETLNYLLAHEHAHIRRFDAVTKLALTAALCVHWFNPAVWFMVRLANRDIELACDEAVVRQLGEGVKSDYAMTLIRMEETRRSPAPLCNNFSQNAIEERIVAIMEIKKLSMAAVAAAAALVLGVTIAFATSAKDSGEPQSEGPKYYTSDTARAGSVAEGNAVTEDFLPYEPYGLLWDQEEQALYWNGQRVRYFLDGADLDGTGAMAVRMEYAYLGPEGEIDVHTVRQRLENADGSFDPMGPLVGLEAYSREDFEERVFLDPSLEQETYADQDFAKQTAETKELLELYAPFGLTYEIETDLGDDVFEILRMYWRGKSVHSVYDGEKGVWIANSMRGLYLGSDAMDLEAVYENGRLTGLRESQSHATTEISFVSEGNTAEPGTTFAEIFEKYAPFGITYVEMEGKSGRGNVYYNGRLVGRFVDLSPDGGAFTFSSSEPGVIVVKTIYDKDGNLSGIGTIE